MINRSQILTEVPPITDQDIFVLFDRKKDHFDYPVHVHNEYELTYIIGAPNAHRVVGDSIKTIGEKDLVLICGSKLEHAWLDGDCAMDGDIREITIQFSETLFSKHGFLSRKQFSQIRTMFQRAQYGLSFSDDTIDKAAVEIQNLIDGGSDFTTVLTFLKLLNILAEDKDSTVLSHEHFSQSDEVYDSKQVKVVMDYLKANYHQKLKLADVASVVNMSEASFTRFVRKRTGFSFVDCLNNIRLGAASRMLIDEPGTTIAEIAYRCGFNNLSNFNRAFKAHKGCTPHEFREYYRKNKIII